MSGTPVISDPVLLKADDWSDYELLDSGNGRKLERFGSQTTDRPDPQAFWAPNNPTDTWTADAVFSSSGDDERGNWIKANPKMPDDWKMGCRACLLKCAARRFAIWVSFRNTPFTGDTRRRKSALLAA